MNSHAFSTLGDNKLTRVYRPDWGRKTNLLFSRKVICDPVKRKHMLGMERL